ncbi:hypothetical protein HUZ36_19025 [Pseudoalteromonas sp. McH1-7]|uniref:hypothetical protein n=1 Tax=unclassified Pseudoalteromonas TaxID=194690 RepID=UPI000FFF382E|nr:MULTISPECIES: hypothetical protein [unclassified Pseudoalteromonas]NUZ12876.1 hypothetical protein [Pseudoalteromonas sp. McH1-7]RXE96111.1 hypothetical protein D9603_19225 [Pseudoalteromonas sp. PS5]
MSFTIKAETNSTYYHSGVGFKLSYPSGWEPKAAEETEIEFAPPSYIPKEEGEFVMLLEAGEVTESKLELITLSLLNDSESTPTEVVQDTVEMLLKSNEVQTGTVEITSEISSIGSKGISFQKLKYMGLDTLIGCFRVGSHIVTVQIMQALENQALEQQILESVVIDL